jgi:hypothetical protein
MTSLSRFKLALLSAASLTAATAGHAAASPFTPPAPIEHAADAGYDNAQRASAADASLKAGLAAAALGVLFSLIGWKRVRAFLAAAAPAIKKAASAVSAASASAIRATVRAVGSPMRRLSIFIALVAFALTGLWLYDLEWAGGLLAGALIAAAIFLGARRIEKLVARLRPARH